MNIGMSESAALQVCSLIESQNNPDLKLRIYITGGGCSGFQYGFKMEAQAQDDDFVISTSTLNNGQTYDVVLLVDSTSAMYMEGATVDYKKDLKGAYFTVDNPNAVTTCGCGTSFAIE